MKNKKRYKMAAAGLLCAGLLWAGAMNGYAKEAEGLTLPDKEIVNYFISGFKTTPQSDYLLTLKMETIVVLDMIFIAIFILSVVPCSFGLKYLLCKFLTKQA